MSERFLALEGTYRNKVDDLFENTWGVQDTVLDKFVPFGKSPATAKNKAEQWNRNYPWEDEGDPTSEGWAWGWLVPEEPTPTEKVNHPDHYLAGGLEAIDVLDAFAPDNPIIWNALKYVLRHDKKGGIEDLKKAVWYLQREIEKREAAVG